jgi:hypothetical protein
MFRNHDSASTDAIGDTWKLLEQHPFLSFIVKFCIKTDLFDIAEYADTLYIAIINTNVYPMKIIIKNQESLKNYIFVIFNSIIKSFILPWWKKMNSLEFIWTLLLLKNHTMDNLFGNLNRQINFLTNYWKNFLLNTKTNTWNSWFYGYAHP